MVVFLFLLLVMSMQAILRSLSAYSKCVCVASVAADYTPACYTDYGTLVTLSAP